MSGRDYARRVATTVFGCLHSWATCTCPPTVSRTVRIATRSDPVKYLLILFFFLVMPSVVQTLGFNRTITLVLTCPPYLLAAFASVAVSWSSGRFNERTWHITASKAVAIVGFIIGVVTLNVGARYFAMCLFVGAVYGVNNINLAWTAATVGQTNEKKTVAIAIVNTMGNLSFVYTPYLWPDTDKPRYAIAMWSSVGFSAGTVVIAWALKFILSRDNKKIRQANPEAVNFYVY